VCLFWGTQEMCHYIDPQFSNPLLIGHPSSTGSPYLPSSLSSLPHPMSPATPPPIPIPPPLPSLSRQRRLNPCFPATRHLPSSPSARPTPLLVGGAATSDARRSTSPSVEHRPPSTEQKKSVATVPSTSGPRQHRDHRGQPWAAARPPRLVRSNHLPYPTPACWLLRGPVAPARPPDGGGYQWWRRGSSPLGAWLVPPWRRGQAPVAKGQKIFQNGFAEC
jgi:hypothetical protein